MLVAHGKSGECRIGKMVLVCGENNITMQRASETKLGCEEEADRLASAAGFGREQAAARAGEVGVHELAGAG